MADLELFAHPLVTEGPIGIDDNGEQWLNGERPYQRLEERALRRQYGERRRDLVKKDDWLGWLNDETFWEVEDEFSGDALLQPAFYQKRSQSPDMFIDERPGETWRNSDFFQSDRPASLLESAQLEEALKCGLPLTVVEQYDSEIYSRQLFPRIGQEIVLDEDRRLLPSSLKRLTHSGMEKLYASTQEDDPVGGIYLRWKLARRGVDGFDLYLKWLRSRRAACRRFSPALHNLLWYLNNTEEWLRVEGLWVRGSMAISGLQLMLCKLWGVGYALHQRQAGSWFRRAVEPGPERILHMTIKCQHADSEELEGVEGSRCFQCSKIARIFEMGYVATAYFLRYIEPQFASDVFAQIYPTACVEFHSQIYWLMQHLTNCSRLCSTLTRNASPNAIALAQPCFYEHDELVKASDAKLTAMARKRLAAHTTHQCELFLTEGCLEDSDYEGEPPSLDTRGEDAAFHWDINW